MLIGRLPDADGAERSAARDRRRDLRRFGLVVPDRRAESGQAGGIVGIAVLGPFTVTVDGADVP